MALDHAREELGTGLDGISGLQAGGVKGNGSDVVTVVVPASSGNDRFISAPTEQSHLVLLGGTESTSSTRVFHLRTPDQVLTATSAAEDIRAAATPPGPLAVSFGRTDSATYRSTTTHEGFATVSMEGRLGNDLLIVWGEGARALGGGGSYNTLHADWSQIAGAVDWDMGATLGVEDAQTLGNGWTVQGIHRVVLRLGDEGNSLTTAAHGNSIIGGAGDDTVTALFGGDIIDLSGGGNNTVTVAVRDSGGSDNTLTAGAGDDRLELRAEAASTATTRVLHGRYTDDEGSTRIVTASSSFEAVEDFLARTGPQSVSYGRTDSATYRSTTTHEGFEHVSITGGLGNDLLIAQGSDVHALGGRGSNTLYADWRGQTADVTWDLAATLGEDDAQTLANGWTVQGIHRLLLRLGDGDHVLTTVAPDNTIIGGTGNHSITALFGGDSIDLSVGGDNHVTVAVRDSGGSDNTLTAGAGDDRLELRAEAASTATTRVLHGRYTDDEGSTRIVTASSSFEAVEDFLARPGPQSVSYGRTDLSTYRSTTSFEGFEHVSITGGLGNDLLIVQGSDVHGLGGGGSNTLYADWRGQTADVTWDMRDTLEQDGLLANGWTVQGIHRALLRLGDGNHSLTTAGAGNTIIGGAGNDRLTGLHGGDAFDMRAGGDNTLTVTARDTGSAADNLVLGGDGTDRVTIVADSVSTSTVRRFHVAAEVDGVTFVLTSSSSNAALQDFVATGADFDVRFGSTSSASSRSTTRFDGIDALSYVGGIGNDLMIGLGGDELFRGGPGNDVAIGNGGQNTFIGTAAELDGDSILDFGTGDVIVVEERLLAPEAVVFDADTGRLELREGGQLLAGITLIGSFDPAGFVVTTADDGATRIRYAGEGPPEPVPPELRFGAVQDGPAVQDSVLADIGLDGAVLTAVDGAPLTGPRTIAGSFGTLVIAPDGSFAYDPDRATALPEGQLGEDVFALTVTGPEGQTVSGSVTFSVTGINDPAVIHGTGTGAVVELDDAATTTGGTLAVEDPDTGEDRFADLDPTALQGVYGAFGFDPISGAWSYTLDNQRAAVQALGAGEQVTDTLTVSSLDGTASAAITVTVTGSGDRTESWALAGQVVDRAGNGLADTLVTFAPETGESAAMTTDAQGRFGFDMAAGTEGHLDAMRPHTEADPGIRIATAIDTLRLALGLPPSWGQPATAHDFIAADFDGDGRVGVADAIALLRVALNLPSEHAPRWIFLDPDADLGAIDRSFTTVDTGLGIDGLTPDLQDVSLVGILVGDVQPYV